MRQQIQFTKFPSEYIKCNISEKYNLSKKFYIIYILISKYRTCENYSWITISEIFSFYGYKEGRNKPKAFYEIIDILRYMISRGMITVYTDLNKVSYDTGIKIRINQDYFDQDSHYAIITSDQLDYIQAAEISTSRENILHVFLYVICIGL